MSRPIHNRVDVLESKDATVDLTSLAATAVEINRAADLSSRIVNTTASLALTLEDHSDKIVTVNKADGAAITLPAATGSGAKFTVIIGTTITSSSTTIKVVGNDTMTGGVIVMNDSDGTVSGFETAATSDTITLNGSTTGGIKGDKYELVDIATDLWYVAGLVSGTGTEATPFSATVT